MTNICNIFIEITNCIEWITSTQHKKGRMKLEVVLQWHFIMLCPIITPTFWLYNKENYHKGCSYFLLERMLHIFWINAVGQYARSYQCYYHFCKLLSKRDQQKKWIRCTKTYYISLYSLSSFWLPLLHCRQCAIIMCMTEWLRMMLFRTMYALHTVLIFTSVIHRNIYTHFFIWMRNTIIILTLSRPILLLSLRL